MLDNVVCDPDTLCKDPGKEVAVMLPKLKTGSSVGMLMIGRFWHVKGNVVINSSTNTG